MLSLSSTAIGVFSVVCVLLAGVNPAVAASHQDCLDLCNLDCDEFQDCRIHVHEGECECRINSTGIALIVVGIIVFILAIVACCWCCRRKHAAQPNVIVMPQAQMAPAPFQPVPSQSQLYPQSPQPYYNQPPSQPFYPQLQQTSGPMAYGQPAKFTA